MRNSLGINIAKLVTSKVGAQAIAIVTAPIIARLYLPDAFGVRQIFLSIAGIIIVVSCLRYELSIPLARDEKEASASLVLSLLFTLVFTIAALAVVPVLRDVIARRFNAPELKVFLWLLPAGVFLGGLWNSLNYWASRGGRFGAMAWSGFGYSLVISLVVIAWALIIGGTAAGLLAGYLAGMIFGLIVLLLFLSRKMIFDIRKASLSFISLRTLAKQHRKFPLFSTWSGLLSAFSWQFPPIILGVYFSMNVVGYYSLGYRLVALPMSLLGTSIAQVFFPAASKEYKQTGNLSIVVRNMFSSLVQIGLFPMVMLGFLSVPLFAFVFGEKWSEAGVYVQILSGLHFLIFLSSPLCTVFNVLNRQETSLAFNVAFICFTVPALILGAMSGSPRIALGLYVLCNMIIRCALICCILRYTHVPLQWGGIMVLKYAILSCLLVLPIAQILRFFSNGFLASIGVFFAIIIYLWVLYSTKRSERGSLIQSLIYRFSKKTRATEIPAEDSKSQTHNLLNSVITRK